MMLNDSKFKLHSCTGNFVSSLLGQIFLEKSLNSRWRKVTKRVLLTFWNQFASIIIACFEEPKTINKNFVSYTLASLCACGTVANAA